MTATPSGPSGSGFSASAVIADLLNGSLDCHVVSHNRSQYTGGAGGASACGIAAMNCARIVLGKERSGILGERLLDFIMQEDTFDDVLTLCSTWSSVSHLDVDDIERAPAFRRSLQRQATDYGEAGEENFVRLLRRVKDLSETSRRASCVVITRPPEIISCFYIPCNETGVYVVFDSHPRPDLHPRGAAFIFYGSAVAAASYLARLLHFDPAILAERGMQWEAQLLSHFSGHIFLASPGVPDERFWEDVAFEASLQVISARSDTSTRERELQDELNALRRLLQHELEVAPKQQPTRTVPLPPPPPEEMDWQPTTSTAPPQRRRNGVISALFGQGGAVAPTTRGPAPRRPTASWSSRVDPFPLYAAPAPAPTARTRVPPPRMYPGSDPTRTVAPPSTSTHPYPITREPVPPARSAVAAGKAPARDSVPPPVPSATVSTSRAPDTAEDLAFALEQQRLLDEEGRARSSGRPDIEDFQCGICFEAHSFENVAEVAGCGHRYCRDCLRSYVSSQVEGRTYPMVCPMCMVEAKSDRSTFDSTLVQQLGLSEEQFAIFVELELSSFSVIVQCRTCNNSFYADRQELEATEIIACPLPRCNASWCRRCNRNVNPGTEHSCDGTTELNRLMGERGWKYCPGCRTPAEKIDGCNHIKCTSPGCIMHFCYRCGATIIQSISVPEINAALSAHYRNCDMFEEIPDRGVPP